MEYLMIIARSRYTHISLSFIISDLRWSLPDMFSPRWNFWWSLPAQISLRQLECKPKIYYQHKSSGEVINSNPQIQIQIQISPVKLLIRISISRCNSSCEHRQGIHKYKWERSRLHLVTASKYNIIMMKCRHRWQMQWQQNKHKLECKDTR